MTVRPPVIKRLFAHSGNQCAFPTCNAPIVDGSIVLGRICHIAAASSDGPRYDASQADDVRNGFDNLILLCPNHHAVIDADLEAYSVERLQKMKRDHEARSGTRPSDEANEATILLLDQSIHNENQSGGLAAHTVNAGSINIYGKDSAERTRTSQAVEVLWGIILAFKQEFGDVVFIDTIFTPEELNELFGGRASHPMFETIGHYRPLDAVIQKMTKANFKDAEKERPFISQRLWAIYYCIQAVYARAASLFQLSFKERKFKDWRDDDGITAHLRAILPEAGVQQLKSKGTYALQTLNASLEQRFLEVASQEQGQDKKHV
ncbi:hypothetical protein HAP48_0011260 [Bradyrhizobium septentrionale]|uniref:HNH endonuclease n=1 Tax=Bradyrhizobium septentrionale TaxID=1404411 RepID=A0A973W8T0_9BRAD|nr:hypothetical protein [Bradyrhizobium septentrionale]UGY17950.1 hypothetical protein HAP48_0011260 [Bradyrhizobium septentrionale]